MNAPGGTIGSGLFVGSGRTLALEGQFFTLVSSIMTTILAYFIVTAKKKRAHLSARSQWHDELLWLPGHVKEYELCDGLFVLMCS
jgi:hypothetical protein